MRLLSCLLLASLLTGCGLLYKVDVPQGNLLDQKALADVQTGMTKRQVSLLLGTPAVTSPFHQDRWDYLYSISRRGRAPEIRNLRLHFEGNALARMEGDLLPEDTLEESLLEDVRQYERYGPALNDPAPRSRREDTSSDD